MRWEGAGRGFVEEHWRSPSLPPRYIEMSAPFRRGNLYGFVGMRELVNENEIHISFCVEPIIARLVDNITWRPSR